MIQRVDNFVGDIKIESPIDSKQLLVLLEKIQLGDRVTGQIIKQNDRTYMRLENGMMIAASCKETLLDHTAREFIVTAKTRCHLEVTPFRQEESKEKQDFIEKAVIQLGLERNELTKQVLMRFIEKQLPLTKEQLTQVIKIGQYLEFPVEPLVNLLARQETVSLKEVQLMMNLKKEGFTDFFTNIKKAIDDLPENTALIESSIEEGITFQNETESSMQSGLNKEELYKLLEAPSLSDKKIGDLRGEELTQTKEILLNLLKDKMTLNLDSEELEGQVEKIFKVAKMIKQTIEQLRTNGVDEVENEKIQSLEQFGQLIEKYDTQAQYFCFPLQIREQRGEGELYFFKSKKNKKDNTSGIYMVLSLNMPALNKIEIHLKQTFQKIDLTFKVDDEPIKELIENHKETLRQLMEMTSFPLENIKCELNTEKCRVQSFEEREVLSGIDIGV